MKIMKSILISNCMFLIAVMLSGCGDKSGTGVGVTNNNPQTVRSEINSTKAPPANTTGGSIEGVVYAGLLNDASCTGGNAVYVFEKRGTIPDDKDGIGVEPVDVVYPDFDNSTRRYNYRVPYLKPGEYTLAFTCQAGNDISARDDAIQFLGITGVTVSPGQRVIKHLFVRKM